MPEVRGQMSEVGKLKTQNRAVEASKLVFCEQSPAKMEIDEREGF